MPRPSDQTLRADAVVIGTGAGGAPVAAALAAAGLEVIALEAGPRLSSADFTGREGEMLARLMTVGISQKSGMELYAGSCVGGSTVVNDALCWRTPPEVLQSWRRQYGLTGLASTSFGLYVDRVWRQIHAEPTGRSHLNRNAHMLAVGAAHLGWEASAMHRNVRGCVNLGLCNLGCPSGAKQSTLLTYVPEAEKRGARILANVRALRVEVAEGAVRAVEALRLSPETRAPVASLRIETPRVCVAAGVLGTGALLLRSGLGGGDAPVGRGLQFHSSAYVTARFREPVYGFYGPTMSYAVTEFADVNGRRGPGFMLENVSTAQVTTAAGLPGFGAEHERAMRALPHLARAVVVLRDRTRGRVSLDGYGDGNGTARFEYDPVPEDRVRMREGIRALARVYLAAGAEEIYLPVNGLAPVRDEADLAALDRLDLVPHQLSLLYAVHLFGGAAMGGRRATSCCSEDGAFWGVRGLWVSDAAALPSNTGVNPQVTIMANALRVADAIAETA